ncbi:hypothetical protein HanIR_Chr12g0589831 [Helianthus annuus]|nr:hypothetical protein HanIR_Chr12g0589831 [Helianthus annuus]
MKQVIVFIITLYPILSYIQHTSTKIQTPNPQHKSLSHTLFIHTKISKQHKDSSPFLHCLSKHTQPFSLSLVFIPASRKSSRSICSSSEKSNFSDRSSRRLLPSTKSGKKVRCKPVYWARKKKRQANKGTKNVTEEREDTDEEIKNVSA